MEDIKIISDKIHNRTKRVGFLDDYQEEINKIDLNSFLIYNIQVYSDVYLYPLLMEMKSKGYLDSLTYQDWKNIIISISPNIQALVFLITFFYKYIRIDIFYLIDSINEIDKENTFIAHKYFNERPGYLHYSKYDEIYFSDYNLSLESFDGIRSAFTIEGIPIIHVEETKFNSSDMIFDPKTNSYIPRSEDK